MLSHFVCCCFVGFFDLSSVLPLCCHYFDFKLLKIFWWSFYVCSIFKLIVV